MTTSVPTETITQPNPAYHFSDIIHPCDLRLYIETACALYGVMQKYGLRHATIHNGLLDFRAMRGYGARVAEPLETISSVIVSCIAKNESPLVLLEGSLFKETISKVVSDPEFVSALFDTGILLPDLAAAGKSVLQAVYEEEKDK